ncbi:ccr4-not transcription complex subunit 2 [Anaeramoeba flamelloides]|uniref:Ccr4-not transcription complex subunit 2 n=1 Tax=Anaeramoeba flamelloides TaxID=1746091 RepID=A0ABQ8YUL7_9EUKA|nr:ccr4-not transcription complex subunit 2 [Anaeramoeba flamelloides]
MSNPNWPSLKKSEITKTHSLSEKNLQNLNKTKNDIFFETLQNDFANNKKENNKTFKKNLEQDIYRMYVFGETPQKKKRGGRRRRKESKEKTPTKNNDKNKNKKTPKKKVIEKSNSTPTKQNQKQTNNNTNNKPTRKIEQEHNRKKQTPQKTTNKKKNKTNNSKTPNRKKTNNSNKDLGIEFEKLTQSEGRRNKNQDKKRIKGGGRAKNQRQQIKELINNDPKNIDLSHQPNHLRRLNSMGVGFQQQQQQQQRRRQEDRPFQINEEEFPALGVKPKPNKLRRSQSQRDKVSPKRKNQKKGSKKRNQKKIKIEFDDFLSVDPNEDNGYNNNRNQNNQEWDQFKQSNKNNSKRKKDSNKQDNSRTPNKEKTKQKQNQKKNKNQKQKQNQNQNSAQKRKKKQNKNQTQTQTQTQNQSQSQNQNKNKAKNQNQNQNQKQKQKINQKQNQSQNQNKNKNKNTFNEENSEKLSFESYKNQNQNQNNKQKQFTKNEKTVDYSNTDSDFDSEILNYSSEEETEEMKEKYLLKGLLKTMKMSDSNLNTLMFGIDLQTLDLDLNTSDTLYSHFDSPWGSKDYQENVDFEIPEYYTLNPPPVLTLDQISHFSDMLLLYIFYSSPRDALQIAATEQLIYRGWMYHKELSIWLIQDPETKQNEKEIQNPSTFLFFNPDNWEIVRQTNFTLKSEDVL